ncbi:MAG: FAD-binding oxidoreductase [Acidobacteriaceae bacterium]|nr:FAD-binding oxidoreductase [Acidobacteriaceae bacterium]
MAEAARMQQELIGFVPRGNGRAYGDAAIGKSLCLSTLALDRFCHFDTADGRLTVEAGVLLSDILDTLLPRGFFPPIVPGTRLVSVGGMIAADVHGKNHHRAGSFGAHVESFTLALPDGKTVTCSAAELPKLFAATLGGMGLSGTILSATFKLRRVETGWVRQRTLVAPDLNAALDLLSRHDDATYSAAWIDCVAKGSALGRSLIHLGEHASQPDVETLRPGSPLFPKRRDVRIGVPWDLPRLTLNRWSIAAFNEAYFRKGIAAAEKPFLSGVDAFFFPLDGVRDWNRIYGRGGFLQHQSVVPADSAKDTLGEVLERIAARGNASFLAVLKKLGPPSAGIMSFPMAGFTLALDFPLDDDILEFLDEIDRLVMAAGGRIYLAKDARQSRAVFEAGYSRLAEFREIRREVGASARMASRLSERLGI